MEKHRPHHRLAAVKDLVSQGRIRTTMSASRGAGTLGFEMEEIPEVVRALTPGDFYKSMTTHLDHREWQDVYRPHTRRGGVYLKLTVFDDVVVVSFKEL